MKELNDFQKNSFDAIGLFLHPLNRAKKPFIFSGGYRKRPMAWIGLNSNN